MRETPPPFPTTGLTATTDVFCSAALRLDDAQLPVEASSHRAQIPRTKTNHPKNSAMKTPDKKGLLMRNTILWLFAMVLPAFFSIALASAKFPWPMIVPLLLFGPMLASNKMLSRAMGPSTDAQSRN
jgi:hypothetical protein